MQFIDIQHPLCRARISLKGGQLLSWKPSHATEDVLWCTQDKFFREDKPIRGGIPICWPWFGKAKTPAHGFARNMLWTQQSIQETQEGVDVVLSLSDTDYSRQLWPHSFLLTLRFHLGRRCQVELSIHTEGVSHGALHSYFYVNNIQKLAIEGTGPTFINAITGLVEQQPQHRLTAPVNVDRIYTQPSPTTQLLDVNANRTIRLTHSHCQDLVIWNPGSEAAARLGDIEANDYQSFVCVETAAISTALGSSIGVTIELSESS